MSEKGRILADRYELKELIGQGGMADVYLAYDDILKREVAVKILRSSLTGDPIYITRFHREARAAAALCHRNIVEIYDVGEEDDLYYIVMEYVRGQTLKATYTIEGEEKPAGWKKPKLYVGRIPYEKLADPASPKAEELYAMIADTATATPAEKGYLKGLLSQDKYPATTHLFELPYNGTTLPQFSYYTNQSPYLSQTYTKYNNHHPYSNLPH